MCKIRKKVFTMKNDKPEVECKVPQTWRELLSDRLCALKTDIPFGVIALIIGIAVSYFGKAALISAIPNFFG